MQDDSTAELLPAALRLPVNVTTAAIARAVVDSVTRIRAEATTVRLTLGTVHDLLATLKNPVSGGLGVGLIALPVPLAARAALIPINRYLKGRTGYSVDEWLDFVNQTQEHFDRYLEQVARIAELDAELSEKEQTAADPAMWSDYHMLLRDTRAKTNVWKPVLEQLSRMIDLVDAFIDTAHERALSGAVPAEASSDATPVPSWIPWRRRRGGTVGEWLQAYLLARFGDVKRRSDELREQVSRLVASVDEFEDLLDLELTQLHAASRGGSPAETQLVEVRVAASILLPRLVAQLADARTAIERYERYLRVLEEARSLGTASDTVYVRLHEEYENAVVDWRERLRAIETEARLWAEEGQSALEASLAWIATEQDLLRGRLLVGETSPDRTAQHLRSLDRERERVHTALAAVRGLSQPSPEGATVTI